MTGLHLVQAQVEKARLEAQARMQAQQQQLPPPPAMGAPVGTSGRPGDQDRGGRGSRWDRDQVDR